MTLLPFAVSAQPTIYISNAAEFINVGYIGGPVLLKLTADITLTNVTDYITITGGDVTFDGDNYTITINTGGSYPGLFRNGSPGGINNGFSNITIKNINVSVPGSDALNIAGGWIGQDGFGFNATNVIIDNCHTDYQNAAVNNATGGIVGRYSPATVTNCSSKGPIPSNAGGICGKFFSGTVINCHSAGNISASGGGITGSFCTGKAINCYSTGNISNSGSGIMGNDAGNDGFGMGNYVTITNCYSRGNMGTNASGIMGNKGKGNVTNCYSTGTAGTSSGGIIGGTGTASVTITNCYTIAGLAGYGVTGATIINCVANAGSWNDNDANSVLTGTDGTVWIGNGLWQPYTLAPYVASSIITTANFGTFTTYSGVPSDIQAILVSATSLLSNITIDAPMGYELSASPTGTFSSSLSISPIAGILDITVYIRLTNAVVNVASGNITVASTGFTTQYIATGQAVLQSASANRYGSKTVDAATRINKNGAIDGSGVGTHGEIILYLPSLSTTSPISSITQNDAVSGGTILSDGGTAIIASGVCWSLNPNPTTADSHTNDGTSLTFTSSLTGLITGTKYYVRAYATNSEGTSYGTGVSFTTP